MMLAHPQLDAVFDFSSNKVNTLVIEAPPFFRGFLRDISSQIRGFPGAAVLSNENMPIEFRGNAELIDSLLSFELGRKALITKLIARMEAIAVDESHYIHTAQLTADLEQLIYELGSDLPCGITCGKMSIGSILRSVGIEILDDYENDLERLLDFMEMTRELDRDKLFIFVNLRSYYSDEDIAAFFTSVLDHGYHVLLVDSSSRPLVSREARITVDIDLCEF